MTVATALLFVSDVIYITLQVVMASFGLHYWGVMWDFWTERMNDHHRKQQKLHKSKVVAKQRSGPSLNIPTSANGGDALLPTTVSPQHGGMLSTATSGPTKAKAAKAWPKVTIQLPIFNEGSVVVRLIEHCLLMDYPADKLEIQVLDDSIDNTPEIVAATLRRLHPHNFPVRHIRRSDRVGYKAGALQAGLSVATGDYLAIFDADFVPEADWLKKTMPYFWEEPVEESKFRRGGLGEKGICCVQTRWGHVNRDYSLLTKLQAMAIDGHFCVEQPARYKAGLLLNFNGTGGIWRKDAIEDAGGWQWDTLAEDLDLSLRAQFGGWQIVYTADIVCPSEVPPCMSAFKKQQERWAKGTIQCARKHLKNIWTVPKLSLRQRVAASYQVSGFGLYTLMLIQIAVTIPSVFLNGPSDTIRLLDGFVPFFVAFALGPTFIPLSAVVAQGRSLLKALQYVPGLMCIGYGLMLGNAVYAVKGLWSMGGEFVRTPKFAITNEAENYFEVAEEGDKAAIAGAPPAPEETEAEKAAKAAAAAQAAAATNAEVDRAASKLFPKTELAFMVVLLACFGLKAVLHEGLEMEASNVWVGICLISQVMVVWWGWCDVRDYRKAHSVSAAPAGGRAVV